MRDVRGMHAPMWKTSSHDKKNSMHAMWKELVRDGKGSSLHDVKTYARVEAHARCGRTHAAM
jgi:hypothetical protein